MSFICEHAGFRAAANHPVTGYLGPGNVMSGCQSSTFVRAKTQTVCAGKHFETGVLRDHDLDFFAHIPAAVRRAALDETEAHEIILYRFFHWRARHRVEHGWLITDRAGTALHTFVTGPTRKSRDILDKAAAYIAAKS